jgi:uncharacterized membrane protein
VNARLIARAGIYAALYAALVLTPGLNSLAYGQVQFRVAEGLMAFACFDLAAVPGLTLGTALGNTLSPLGIVDVVVGAALTFVAALLMWRIGPRWWALVVPVVVNGLGVAGELALVLGLPYWPSAGFVALGESVVMASVGGVMFGLARRYGTLLGLQRHQTE